jgi:hypothetical protein
MRKQQNRPPPPAPRPQLYITIARPTHMYLEKWRFARALVDFHAAVPAHAYLGAAAFVLSWIHTIAHLVSYGYVSSIASAAAAGLREPASTIAAQLPLSYQALFLSDAGYGGLVPGWAGPTGLALIAGARARARVCPPRIGLTSSPTCGCCADSASLSFRCSALEPPALASILEPFYAPPSSQNYHQVSRPWRSSRCTAGGCSSWRPGCSASTPSRSSTSPTSSITPSSCWSSCTR